MIGVETDVSSEWGSSVDWSALARSAVHAAVAHSRHSGLAEIAGAFEAEVGRPGFFSFEPGQGAVRGLAQGIDRLLSLPDGEREELRRALGSFVATHWTWERTAVGLLAAAEPVG